MGAYLEVWRPEGPTLVALESQRATLGKAPTNDIVFAWDQTVSRLHAVLEELSSHWCVRDLSSSNGTFVNGERISTDRPLHPGDELRVGETRVFFRSDTSTNPTATATGRTLPSLTPRERDVLVALCRPLLSGDVFTEPASIRAIAEELVVSDAAVKQHLTKLYDKFGIYSDDARRRVRLANEAVRGGAVTASELKAP